MSCAKKLERHLGRQCQDRTSQLVVNCLLNIAVNQPISTLTIPVHSSPLNTSIGAVDGVLKRVDRSVEIATLDLPYGVHKELQHRGLVALRCDLL